ncbi:MAG TPA: hypothetical protein VLE99_06765 [Candidatus Saccharimonadales bacterium]|nr:hypothetical protein [Candidatus Saccharimonadales bacterium]
MIQLNLLPNVKLEYVKTQRTKRMLTVVSFFTSIAALALLGLSFVTVDVVQKKNLSDLNNDIAKYSKQLKGVNDLDKILTVQNQLNTLTSLHSQKPVTSRLFSYISQLTPGQASLSQLSIDFGASTMSIGGSAPSLDVVSTYTDTLKQTTYTDATATSKRPFTNVVLSTFGRTQAGATFTITCSFDPAIFNVANTITLNVPQTAGADQSSVFGGGN